MSLSWKSVSFSSDWQKQHIYTLVEIITHVIQNCHSKGPWIWINSPLFIFFSWESSQISQLNDCLKFWPVFFLLFQCAKLDAHWCFGIAWNKSNIRWALTANKGTTDYKAKTGQIKIIPIFINSSFYKQQFLWI